MQTNDARLSNDRSPTAGSATYIQNTTTAQTGANFNIDGTGTADIVNAQTQYNIGGNRILSAPVEENTFVVSARAMQIRRVMCATRQTLHRSRSA